MKKACHLLAMKFLYVVVCLLLLSMTLLAASCNKSNKVGSQFHTSPDKWEKPRIYHTEMDESCEKKISVAKIPVKEIEPKVFSGNSAYWYVLDKQVNKNLQADKSLYVFNERDYLIQVNIAETDHRYDGRAAWINEKLIYYQWWWGRILGGYLIFDVEREKIIQKELVKYGGIAFQQFQQAKNK